MVRNLIITAALVVASAPAVFAQQRLNPVIEKRVDALLHRMTLEEKVGQMAQVSIESLGTVRGGTFLFSDKLKDAVTRYGIGSVLNNPGYPPTPAQWNAIIREIQGAAGQTRLKIPVLYGLDDVHGVNYVAGSTLFPQQIGQAATWNPALVRRLGEITAFEGRAAGVPWTFSPVLDLGVNPLWSRIWEGYGEDPLLAGTLGAAFVRGVQEPLGSREKKIVSVKHFLGYSDPKSGKDRTDAWIPEHYLREYHLPPFAAAIRAGARNVMVNSALINGIPTHVNKHILTDILKGELGFTGFVVSDWRDIENVYRRDHVTASIKEAIALATNAGIDMAMLPYDYKEYCTDLAALVREGKVQQARIDDAVRRILRVKMEAGLFETPLTEAKDYPRFGSPEHAQAAYEVAAESITLLKNRDNVLPLHAGARVLVTGPNAHSLRTLNGGWTYSWQGDRTDSIAAGKYHTFLDAVRARFGSDKVVYEPGVLYKAKAKYWEDTLAGIEPAVRAAARVDYVLLCLGENSYTETPGNLNDLELSGNQLALAQAMIATGKPVILVLNEGRPRIIRRIEPGTAAILYTYLPGNSGADALADILTGKVVPGGKLPITYPRYANDLLNYIHKPSEAQSNSQEEARPQFPFGFGLSYTTFAYSDLKINKDQFLPGDSAEFTITVTNTGAREGSEVVQLYCSDLVASLTPDVRRLRGFEKIRLAAGASRTVRFRIAVNDLAFIAPDNRRLLEEGDFAAEIGGQKASFRVNRTVRF
ncbi:beta-glucosidase [Flaviaesturariibacter flavus]|uniref:beta-glucosidase n=1 Tax=Flaviaesturariibacter flavus TaxID=2502780 RepID=A0A4R1BPI6_9BACT|nr:glycoside hydrolase family 3 N-terminal domain-containing protein [Flaviaesturariibacter flavus]TCJ19593.1 beta-glucosidase [Flaviaesturariibacter flavus]